MPQVARRDRRHSLSAPDGDTPEDAGYGASSARTTKGQTALLSDLQVAVGGLVRGLREGRFHVQGDEFQRLLAFLAQIEFVDLSNLENFQIEDISTKSGPKALIDASDRGLVERLKRMSEGQRGDLLRALQSTLTADEVNILLGRKQGKEV